MCIRDRVSTQKKSQATMPVACWARNSFHEGPSRRGAGGKPCRRSSEQIAVAETETPSFRSRRQDPVPTLKPWATTSGEHTELMAQDQQLNVASNMITIATHSQQTQKLAEGEVDKRQQHRNSRAGGLGSLDSSQCSRRRETAQKSIAP